MYVYKIYLTDQKVYTPEVYKTMKEAEKAADQLGLSFMISVLLANTPIPLSNFDTDNYFIRHGGAYDRGSADSYYERSESPHYYTEGSYHGDRVDVSKSTDVAGMLARSAYMKGYLDQELSNVHKEW